MRRIQMIKRTQKTRIFLLAAVFFLSCDPEGIYETHIDVSGAVTLSNGVAIHENGKDRIIYLSADGSRVSLKELFRASEHERLAWHRVGPDRDNPTELFEMSVPTDERDAERTETLLRIHVDGNQIEKYEVGSLFDSLVFGPMQRFAILYHGDAETESQESLFNPNEVALIDLTKGPGADNPHILSVDLGGGRISGVSFLSPLLVGGKTRQLVIFMTQGAVRLVDLLDPSMATVKVPLTAASDPRTVIPVQVVAREEDALHDTMVFIRAQGSEDIYKISLTAAADGSSGFSAARDQFEAGGEPQDMEVVEDGADPMLVVLSYPNSSSSGSVISVVDVDTADTFAIELDDFVDKTLLRQAEGSQEVVLFGDNSYSVYFLEIEGLAEEKGRNLDEVSVQEGIEQAILLDENRLLIVSYNSEDLILLSLDTQKATRLSSPGAYDWAQARIYQDSFFFVPEYRDRIDIVDLSTEHPESLLLDDLIDSLHLLKGSGTGVALHDTPSGRVTIFPLNNPVRSQAKVIDGIWLNNFLDEE
jgi:hypothetical protein